MGPYLPSHVTTDLGLYWPYTDQGKTPCKWSMGKKTQNENWQQ